MRSTDAGRLGRRIGVVAGLLVIAALGSAAGAQAKPFDSGIGYPRFANEGGYPAGCAYRQVGLTKSASWNHRHVTLRYFYSGCGSYARIDNAPSDCKVYLDRTPTTSRASWDWVAETVDRGITYAYTQVGNNLSGRWSRGALVCGAGRVLARTDWY